MHLRGKTRKLYKLTHLDLTFIGRFGHLSIVGTAANISQICITVDLDEVEAAQVDDNTGLGYIEGCTPSASSRLSQEWEAIFVAILDLAMHSVFLSSSSTPNIESVGIDGLPSSQRPSPRRHAQNTQRQAHGNRST